MREYSNYCEDAARIANHNIYGSNSVRVLLTAIIAASLILCNLDIDLICGCGYFTPCACVRRN